MLFVNSIATAFNFNEVIPKASDQYSTMIRTDIQNNRNVYFILQPKLLPPLMRPLVIFLRLQQSGQEKVL